MKVFISHSFADRPKFEEFSTLLNNEEIPFFRPLDMNGTRSLVEQLKEAITDCEVCIFVATHNSVKSAWCHAELGAFWGAGKDVIIYLADSSLKETQIPKQFQGLLQERDMFRVVKTLKDLVSKELALPAEGFPRARQVHGYSGKWYVKSVFTRWRGSDVGQGESVVFNGETSLFLQMDGRRGWGMQKGTLQVDLKGYHLKLRVCNEVFEASINEKGTLIIKLKVFHRGLIPSDDEGTPSKDLGKDWLKDVDNAPTFRVELAPSPGKAKYLSGQHWFEPGNDLHQIAKEEWTYSEL